MERVTLRIPLITEGPLHPQQVSREFQGALPETESVAFLAGIIREGLEAAVYPEYRDLIENADHWLVQQIALVTAVPNHVWIRNGFYPMTEWAPAHGE
jgi:hypothetical protein